MPIYPHQDPTTEAGEGVSVVEHVTTLIATLDRRFEGLHQDLKEHIEQRFTDADRLTRQRAADADLRYQQRFDGQVTATEAALSAQREAVNVALASVEKATDKAETAANNRFAAVNEFRKTLTDQTATFMPRAEIEARHLSMMEKLDDLKAYQAMDAGKGAGLNQGWGFLVGGIGLVATIITIFFALTAR